MGRDGGKKALVPVDKVQEDSLGAGLHFMLAAPPSPFNAIAIDHIGI